MGEVIHINARRHDVSSIATASNRNESLPRMANPFIAQYPEFRQIPLSKGYVAIVDAENYEWLNQWTWMALKARNTVYAIRRGQKKSEGRKNIYMHRQIMQTPPGMQTDHRDGDGLINCRENLRNCTHSQNQRNQRPQKGVTSEHKGVSWNEKTKKWIAQIKANGKQKYLGSFTSELDAASAYNAAALKYHGEFARLNIIELHSKDEAA